VSSRKEKLLEMLKENPQDTFCLYALAMEEKTRGTPALSLEYFKQLLTIDPDYVAGYLQQAQLLIEQDEKEAAEQVIKIGMQVALKIGDQHAYGEIAGLRDML
jgi:predicted Zn-dependent protease